MKSSKKKGGRAAAEHVHAPLLSPRPHQEKRHGRKRSDPYAWAADACDPELREFLRASNRHARQCLRPFNGLMLKIKSELHSLTPPLEGGAPFRFGRHVYHFMHPGDRDYPVLLRWPAQAPARVETVLDINALARDRRFLAVPFFALSPDERFLAYAMDPTGNRRYQIRVRDLDTKSDLPDIIRNADCFFAWQSDGNAIVYAALDPVNQRPAAVRLRTLGNPARTDKTLYTETDEEFRCYLTPTTSGQYIRIVCFSADTEQTLLLHAASPLEAPLAVARRTPKCVDDVDHGGGLFVIRTNRRRPEFSLFTATLPDLAEGRWRALAAPRAGTFVERVSAFRNHAVATERLRAHQRLRIISLKTGASRTLTFPERVGEAWVEPVPGMSGTTARIGYTSLVTPPAFYNCTLGTGTLRFVQQERTPGYDANEYETWREWATARDGKRIPLTIAGRRGSRRAGNRPALIFAYGAYGTNIPPWFNQARLPLLNRGFIYVMAHVRGGSEMGEAWHTAAMRRRKAFAARDLIDCTRHLVKTGLAARDRIFAETLSAGGITLGGAINEQPGLFRGVIAHAPFVDPAGSLSDPDIPLTLSEYAEWGSPALAADWRAMCAYSPYDNIRPCRHPAMLVTCVLNDSQVPFWEPMKWVARMRRADRGGGPILLLTQHHADHSGPSGRSRMMREQAFEWAFLLALTPEHQEPNFKTTAPLRRG